MDTDRSIGDIGLYKVCWYEIISRDVVPERVTMGLKNNTVLKKEGDVYLSGTKDAHGFSTDIDNAVRCEFTTRQIFSDL